MKKYLISALAIGLICVTVGFAQDGTTAYKLNQKEKGALPMDNLKDFKVNQKIITQMEKKRAVIELEKGGTIEIDFYPKDAPNTVANFIDLASKKYYDGLTFHRVIAKFVAQGGCPLGNGTGGPGYSIKAEFNKQKHINGAVSMARAQEPDSAGSQFYICLGPQSFLDGNYTVFGQVISGMEFVEKIAVGDKMKSITIVDKEKK